MSQGVRRIEPGPGQESAWDHPRPEPSRGYQELRDHLAFHPSRVDPCYVDDERVEPQAGDFYGSWVTRAVVGPFKGAPGTWGW